MPDPEAAAGYAELVLPVLLDEARGVYGRSIRQALRRAGHDDLPRGSARILGGLAREGGPAELGGEDPGSRRQRRLAEALVEAGYLEWTSAGFELTPRGRQAAAVVREAMHAADSAVVRALGSERLVEFRRNLGTIAALHDV